MRSTFAILIVLAAATPALAGVDLTPAVPTEHALEAKYADSQHQRYPTTWGDEAAQTLGVQDGKWEAFATTPSSRFEPSLNAGVDQGSAMLRLSWH